MAAIEQLGVVGNGIGDALYRASPGLGAGLPLFGEYHTLSFHFQRGELTATTSDWIYWQGDGNDYYGVALIRSNHGSEPDVLQVYVTTGTTVRTLFKTSVMIQDQNWHHVLVYTDTLVAGNCKIYLDGVDRTVMQTPGTGANRISNQGAVHWYRPHAQNVYWPGGLAALWIDFERAWTVDQAFVDQFYSGGCPQDLGSDGSTPIGIAPRGYFRGGTANILTNLAQAGVDFTEIGSLTESTTHPSDGCLGGPTFQPAWARRSSIGAGFEYVA